MVYTGVQLSVWLQTHRQPTNPLLVSPTHLLCPSGAAPVSIDVQLSNLTPVAKIVQAPLTHGSFSLPCQQGMSDEWRLLEAEPVCTIVQTHHQLLQASNQQLEDVADKGKQGTPDTHGGQTKDTWESRWQDKGLPPYTVLWRKAPGHLAFCQDNYRISLKRSRSGREVFPRRFITFSRVKNHR